MDLVRGKSDPFTNSEWLSLFLNVKTYKISEEVGGELVGKRWNPK